MVGSPRKLTAATCEHVQTPQRPRNGGIFRRIDVRLFDDRFLPLAASLEKKFQKLLGKLAIYQPSIVNFTGVTHFSSVAKLAKQFRRLHEFLIRCVVAF